MLLCTSLVGCQIGEQQSELFASIYGPANQSFRGVKLGDSLTRVEQQEQRDPFHQDQLGLAYQVPLGEGRELEVTYWADGQQRVQAIVANVFLLTEASARKLYRELANHYTKRSGREPQGAFGNFAWPLEAPGDTLWLRMHETRKSFTLNMSRSSHAGS